MTSQTPPTDKELLSMQNAVEDVGIVAIHPDKLEDFAAHLVNKLKKYDQPQDFQQNRTTRCK